MSGIKVVDVEGGESSDSPEMVSRRLGKEHGAVSMSLSLASMSEGLDDPAVSYPDNDQIIYVLSGTVELTEGGRTHKLDKGKAVFIPRGETYGYRVTKGPHEVIAVYAPGKY